MSDHYDFRLACDVRADTPQQVIETLRYMTRADDYDFNDSPSHPFFASVELYDGEAYDTWRHILQCGEGYTPGVFGSSLHEAYRGDRPGGQQIVVPTLDVHCYVDGRLLRAVPMAGPLQRDTGLCRISPQRINGQPVAPVFPFRRTWYP